MIEMKRAIATLGLAVSLAAFAAHASPVHASVALAPTVGSPPPEIRVVNNHAYRVRVVLVDRRGRHHPLGRVSPTKADVYALDEHMIDGAPLRVQILVDEPVWSAANTREAVRTSTLHLKEGATVTVWVEPNLADTQIDVVR